jgi:hypothetical protein
MNLTPVSAKDIESPKNIALYDAAYEYGFYP